MDEMDKSCKLKTLSKLVFTLMIRSMAGRETYGGRDWCAGPESVWKLFGHSEGGGHGKI